MDRRALLGTAVVAGASCCGLRPAAAVGRSSAGGWAVVARSVLQLTAPEVVVSDRVVQLDCRLITESPVLGVRVELQQWNARGSWSPLGAGVADTRGAVTFRVRAWKTVVVRAVVAGSATLLPATSASLVLRARPSGRIVSRSGPQPDSQLPRGPQAVGAGAHPRIAPIPDRVWASMHGRSWRPGSPVGRSGLRYLTINYWGFDGYRYRGEMILDTLTVAAGAGALAELYSLRFPIRQMVLPDRFGVMSVSPHLGADDYRSMAADNTSGFNYRYVDGTEHTTRVLSPHSYGNAIDINTWENPYADQFGLYPDRYWADRHRVSPASFRTASARATRALTSRGFSWGAGYRDWQHFQRDSGAVPGVEREALYG